MTTTESRFLVKFYEPNRLKPTSMTVLVTGIYSVSDVTESDIMRCLLNRIAEFNKQFCEVRPQLGPYHTLRLKEIFSWTPIPN